MSKDPCAIRGCGNKEFKIITMPGNFGAIVVVPLCKYHYEHIDDNFEYTDENGNVSKASEYLAKQS